MKGLLISFRRGKRTVQPNHGLIETKEIKSKADTSKMLGKKVSLPTKNSAITGKIVSAHGNKGVMRVIFKKAISKDMFGKQVEISE